MSNFPTDYEHIIFTSRYARWLDKKGRREEWPETIDRYISFFKKHLKKNHNYKIPKKLEDRVRNAILNFDIMPSMRCFMTAGPALERCNVSGYNCSYLPIYGLDKKKKVYIEEIDDFIEIGLKKPIDFDEVMYILMCGTGVGFSVERQYINNLPTVGKKLSRRMYLANNVNYPNVDKEDVSTYDKKKNKISVTDSKYGWASALRIFLVELYNGNFDVQYDVSKLRPAGARLKTFGGRSSGPQPLVDLFEFCRKIFKQAEGRKLTSLECHDIVCKIGEVVVVGGVRRSALISLSNLTDDRMRIAKSGEWWKTEPHRALANNSVCYTDKPSMASFLKEWKSLYDSKSGERGIFSRQAARNQVSSIGRRDENFDFGTNPCSEIILRPKQFCNLSEVVIRREDSFEKIAGKVEIATILGTWQSTLTNFKYLSSEWEKNTKEERLLGVSLTGIMDNPLTSGKNNSVDLDEFLYTLKDHAISVNEKHAEELGISQSTAITCVKPSGTVSQLVNSASGIHPRYSEYYIRTIRGDNKDPLTQFLKDSGVSNEPDIMNPNSVTVFSFPVKSPEDAVTRKEISAIEQLELWKKYQDNWCEHKPSITVYVREEEFLEVGHWVYKNFDLVSGISFLPYDDHSYSQAPYQEITEKEYNKAVKNFPKIDWTKLKKYDNIEAAEQNIADYACSGAESCELESLTK